MPDIELKNYTEQQILNAFFIAAQTHQSSIAIWRLPHTREVQLIVSFFEKFSRQAVNLNSKVPGFVISPFINPKGNETIFIPAHLYTRHVHKLNFLVISTIGEILKPLKISPIVEMTIVQIVNVLSILSPKSSF